MTDQDSFGRSIHIFLVDGSPSGLMIASIHGWTGSVLVSTQSTFDRLLARPEVDRTGIYILYGQDPEDGLRMRAYIGEADSVRDRIGKSAGERGFWETAVVVTTSDGALTKGHVRFLEARIIEISKKEGRVSLDNTQEPDAGRRHLPEADRSNMEAFLANLKVILPVVGLDLLKPSAVSIKSNSFDKKRTLLNQTNVELRFEIRHKSGVKAFATEEDSEFIVLENSEALKDAGYKGANSYAELKGELIVQGILKQDDNSDIFRFTRSYAFKSPSAAAAVILDRNSNGRLEWKVENSKVTYHEWQEENAKKPNYANSETNTM
jgi:hypothetical protein